ncbi:MAG: histidinol-phosphatase HisJ family protein [Phycisphaerales bacterium]|nr:MAG: histidinol-phosphatase HisJ family protein [Phycisphaerales bacterium]
MPFHDQHVHSNQSVDSQADPAECVENALNHGLSGITFLEHFDPHPAEWDECIYDDQRYSATIESLRSDSGNRLFIGKGIEVGYCRDRMDFALDFLSRHQFDLVMLSDHFFEDRALHVREEWAGLDATEGTRRFLQEMLEVARFCESVHQGGHHVFHVLGHLDLAKRYTSRFFDTNATPLCSDLIDEILRTCIAANLVPEINTSTLRQGLDEPMPGIKTIVRYAKLGGTAMSIGSDAHLAEHVGADLDHAARLLRAAGLNHVALFKDGKRIDVPLEQGCCDPL